MKVNELVVVLIGAFLNGVALFVGMWLGTRRTADIFEEKLRKILEESPTAQSTKKLIEKLDELVANEEVTKNAAKFFEAATELVTSPEAKNFFKNMTKLMRELGVEPSEVKLKLPEKKK